MKKNRKLRRTAVLLAAVLFFGSIGGPAAPYIESYAYTERPATVNASTLNVRSGPGTAYSIVTKLAGGASVTVIGQSSASDGALWYEIRFTGSGGETLTGYVSRSYLTFPASYSSDADFEAYLTAQGFPESYKVRLRQLHAKYPQWVFQAQHTNLDWNTAVQEESKVGHTLVSNSSMSSWKSTEDGAYDWNTSTWIGYDGAGWVTASQDIVKYYMDPRNFLDETNIFQFLSHSYDASTQTADGLKTMVKGTFLEGSVTGSKTSSSSSGSGGSDPSSYGPGVTGPGAETTAEASVSSDSIISQAPTKGDTGNVSLEAPGASSPGSGSSVSSGSSQSSASQYGPGMNLGSSDSGSAAAGEGSGTVSYTDILMNAAVQSGVNPYVLAAMILQEQSNSGTGGSISGTESGYEGYYNYFNIEAYASGGMTAVQRGLWWASQSGSYGRPWNTQEKSIIGGAEYYGTNYVKVGQDTFYLKKFNVQGDNLYKHQYMTNVQGAASEAAVYAKAYSEEMRQSPLVFKIPVYNNMPDNPCSQPTLDGSPNNKLASLSVDGFTMTPTFSRDVQDYNLIVDSSVTSVTINASVLDSKASVSGTGSVALTGGANDIKISVTAENGTVRDYVIHVVRQDGGPTYSGITDSGTAAPDGAGSGSASDGVTGPGVNMGPGGETSPSTPGGSNVTIIPQ